MKFETDITDTAYGGKGVGRLPDGKAAFIPFTVTGDKVAATVVKDKGSFAECTLDEVITPSPHRITPLCPYHGLCGGCQFGHIDENFELELKKGFITGHLRKLDFIPEIKTYRSKSTGYRIRATMRIYKGRTGFFKASSNEFIPVESCPVLSDKLFSAIKRWGASHYFEDLGQVSAIQTPEGKILASASFKKPLTADRFTGPEPFEGLKISFADAHGKIPSFYYGENMLPYKTPAGDIFVSFDSFFQANRYLIPDFQTEAAAAGGVNVVELYAGSGFFTAALQNNTSKVRAFEINTGAARLARLGGYNVSAKDAAQVSDALSGCDLLFIDPPREGTDRKTTANILKYLPRKIIYVSCNPSTLGRDLQRLNTAYRVMSIDLFDMFPRTYHVETVVHLVLKS